jgi:CHASE2 domain-containing sensor protein
VKDFLRTLPQSIPLDYRAPFEKHPYTVIPAAKMLEGSLGDAERAALVDALVFIGSTSEKAFDMFPSVFCGRMPGVVSHMTVADNLLSRKCRRYPKSWKAGEIGAAAPIAVAAMVLAVCPLAAHLGGLVALALLAAAAHYLAFASGLALNFSVFALSFVVAAAVSLVLRRFAGRPD